MICKPCKDANSTLDHKGCVNRTKLGKSIGTWCDCQHRNEASGNAAKVAAVQARRRPKPTREHIHN